MRLRNFNIGRHLRDRLHYSWMLLVLAITMIVPVALLSGLIYKSSFLLSEQSFFQILFSNQWKPLSGKFGFYPFIISSLWVSVVSLLIAVPICLLTAIHLTQYAKRWVLNLMHPVIDLLAGIPSVIFGMWGILVIVPVISNYIGPLFGKNISGYSILAGAIV
ncbi:MAG: phosphate ABC transporter permease subunit PstC, partial [Bacteroidales bacterium]